MSEDESKKITPELEKFRNDLRSAKLDETIQTIGPFTEKLGAEAILVQVSYTLQDKEGNKAEIVDRGEKYIDRFEDHLLFPASDEDDEDIDDDYDDDEGYY